MRLLYGERRSALVASLHQQLGTRVKLHGAQAGMHLAVTLADNFSDLEIATRAAEKGVWLWPLSPSYLDQPARQGLILGFGNTPAQEMPRAVSQLRAFL
jgi:GntR family transcriptional regulator / MocR family aminotransferase